MRRRASLCGGPTPPCRPLAGTLQSLLHSPPAWHYLASQQHRRKGGCGGGFCMHCELERLAEQYRGGARYFAPRALVQSATRSGLFAMGDMHDSQEFYLHVLDGLLQANLRGKPTPPDPGPLAEPLVGRAIRRPWGQRPPRLPSLEHRKAQDAPAQPGARPE